MEIYLDNSATTRCFPEAARLMYQVMTEDYGNPSSLHQKGVDAEKYMRDTRSVIASNLKVQEKEIFFTSGGTESDICPRGERNHCEKSEGGAQGGLFYLRWNRE